MFDTTVKKPRVPIWWANTIFFVSTHIFALADLGALIGYHRLYSHRAFRAKFAVRVVLAALGSAGFQGSIKRFTDDPVHDPYAATRGLFYSHMGWIFYKPTYDRMELVDREDLDSDPVPLAFFFGFVLPTLLGTLWGDPSGAFVWGGLVARLAIWHCTFLVNSLAHWDGLQPYSDEDTSRGTFSQSPPVNWDPSKWIILLLNRLGLVTGLRSVRENDLKEAMEYMHFKEKHGVAPVVEDAWEGERWDISQAYAYINSKPGSCVVVIDDCFVDATAYLGEHPGGASLLRKYSVRPHQDLIEATWAFDGGLNNHSRSARKRMGEFRIARFQR
ncbi:hypothetical protein B0H17DRAFT_1163477 [Mycena rosella]|uniref:Cytochrome b5 heme-binding domain-containing protein n=1 Tax=Mycena rosella TaxID=1033263 RepID=A0AAD7G3D6_MYCRO|nr:hypothetical protein B0H17DRAFT_1163477 [Mycena rosella]